MIPHILIVDSDTGAARATRAMVVHVTPQAIVETAATLDHRYLDGACPFDLIIIDPSKQHLRDEQHIQQLKHAHPTTPVIILTSTASLAVQHRLLQLGIDGFLEKSEQPQQLLEHLGTMLERLLLPRVDQHVEKR